jgi:hypothetical protein
LAGTLKYLFAVGVTDGRERSADTTQYCYLSSASVLEVMNPKLLLRAEGLVVFAAATAAYVAVGGPLWLYLLLALAPDLSMLGYLAGTRAGSMSYNAAHTYLVPVAIGAASVWFRIAALSSVALGWAAHIGIDRAVGYGLKYPTGFKHTHLSTDEGRDSTAVEPLGQASTDD